MTEASRARQASAIRRGLALFFVAWLAMGFSVASANRAAPADPTGETASTEVWTPRIGVITMGPGSEYWSRFGHNAIIVTRRDGTALSYNYGYFDFAQPNFLMRFVRGRMLYTLALSDLDRELWQYGQEGRSVRLQWLGLAPAQAHRIADHLEWNARPENAEYRYDYFVANCSTRVRDVLDEALGGRLRETARSRSRGLSYRGEAARLGAEIPWMMLGMHLLLGPAADTPLTRWEESFAPEHLSSLLSIMRRDDGKPVVEETIELLPQTIQGSALQSPSFWGRALLISVLACALLVALHASRRPSAARLARWVLGVWWLAAGLIGFGMLGLWFGTDHSMAAANRNLLLFPPIAFGLLPWLFAHRAGGLARATWWLCVAGMTIAAALLFLSVRDQDNLAWLMLALPILVATRFMLPRTTGAPPAV